MKILFLTQRVPYPPNKGDKIRSFHELKHLSQTHDVYLACLAESADELRHRHHLEPYCRWIAIEPMHPHRATLGSLCRVPSRRPLTLGYFCNRRLARQVRRVVAEQHIEAALVFGSGMGQYVDRIDGLRTVVDFVDVDSQKWLDYAAIAPPPKRWVYALEGRRLRRYERQLAERSACAVFCSPHEQQVFAGFAGHVPSQAISNGVDSEFFCPNGARYDPHRVVFCGAMDYYANVDGMLYFHREVWPLVKRDVPQARLTIAGRSPVRAIRQLADDDVQVTGYVHDIRPYVRAAAVSVAPLRVARGIQNKVLESMAMGTPVVATSPAVEGLDIGRPPRVCVADTPETLAAGVVDVIRDRDRRRHLSERGRKCVVDAYAWDARLKALDSLFAGPEEGKSNGG